MIEILNYALRAGLSFGAILLDIGIMAWIASKGQCGEGLRRASVRLICSALALISLAFLLRVW